MNSVRDLAAFFMSNRLQSSLKSQIQTASEAATTGIQPNKTRHLSGHTLALSLLERKSELLEQRQRELSEVSVFTSTAQTQLERLTSTAESLSANLAPASQMTDTGQIAILSQLAAQGFEDVVGILNSNVAGRAVFSGTASTIAPLSDGNSLLTQIETAVTGATNAASVVSVINDWFDDPAGPFATNEYRGSTTGHIQFSIDAETTVTMNLRADSPRIKDLLKSLAIGAIAASSSATFDAREKSELLTASSAGLRAAADDLVIERDRLGLIEATVAQAQDRVAQDIAKTSTDRLSLVEVDQFEELTRFEAAQQQLDILYRLAARSTQTSIAQYLR